MKQLKDAEALISSLIKKEENYIILNDGKAVRENLTENIDINVDDVFHGNEFVAREKSALEKEIEENIFFSTTIIIDDNADLKIIQLSDEQKYLNYNIIVKKGQANISVINLGLETEVKMKVEVLCSKNTEVNLINYTNATKPITTVINGYCLENAKLNIHDLSVNEKAVDNHVNIYLIKNYSEANLTNVLINTSGEKQYFDYYVHHYGKDTKSKLNNYGISKNTSHLVLNNHGIVNKGAVNTDLNQKSDGVILDMYSSISANPILEINDNDVIAGHGAAIGALDDEALYYLMSRGLTYGEASSLMIQAFINPFFRDYEDELVIYYIKNTLKKYL